ncbi:MAG: peptidylprolyl isomerase [Bacteroidota bacterium]
MKLLKIAFLLFFTFSLANAQSKKPSGNDQYVKITTNLGAMVFKLSAETPKHTTNFIRLAKKGYFNTYDFNRVIKGFVIQGGETDSAYAAMEKAGQELERILPEFSTDLFHQKGALAAGRDDNKQKSSFLGQFYVVDGKKYTDVQLDALEKRNGKEFSADARKIYKEVGGTPSLDQNYTVFGQLVLGWDVLDLIAGQQKDKSDRPLTKVRFKVSCFLKKRLVH